MPKTRGAANALTDPESPSSLISSDIQTPNNEWLEEPTLPKKEDFKNPENFEFAFNEYKHKMTNYQARLKLHKACEEESSEEEQKNVFHYLNQIKDYPKYEDFCPFNAEEKALGYGGSAKREGFKPALVSEWIAKHEKLHFKTDMETGILYFFNGKCWVRNAEPYLEKIISLILKEENRQSYQQNITQSLRPLTYDKIVFSQKLACENCLLDVETLETSEFNDREMPFHQIPVTYNKDASKDKLVSWLEFLNQVANSDDIPLLQEWFGYCLLADYRFHKALWIHGEGRNGKGVFDRTIKGIIGLKNVSTVGLEQLDGSQRFILKNLYGKLYNSSSEPTTNKIFQTEIFQKVTGGDLISAEFKNKNQEVEFTNSSKITIIGNKFPRINSPTQAFKDRMIFVKFPNHFDDKAQIQNLENVWLNDSDQRSAILNWALEGLQRLLSQGHFSLTKTQEQILIEFNRVSDSITAFQMETGVLNKNLATTRADTLLAYQEYCEEIGAESRKASQLTQGMQRLSPKVKDGWIYKPKKERAWLGFGLKDREQQSIEQIEQKEHLNILSSFSEPSKILKEETPVLTVLTVLNESQLKVVTEESGLRHIETGKPIWFVKDIPQGAKCECGALNVTKEIVTPQKDAIKRCTQCYEKLKQSFPNADWKPAYPEMPNYEAEAS